MINLFYIYEPDDVKNYTYTVKIKDNKGEREITRTVPINKINLNGLLDVRIAIDSDYIHIFEYKEDFEEFSPAALVEIGMLYEKSLTLDIIEECRR